jgi:phage-related protein (TIGR01555 family)
MSEVNQKVEFRNDEGWYNLFTGVGRQATDKRVNTQFGLAHRLDYRTLTQMYEGEGLGRSIAEIPSRDMVREWFTVEGDPDGLALNKLGKLSAKKHFFEALTWNRVYGGSVILMLIDDGRDLVEEVDESQINDIVSLQVFDRWDVTWMISDLIEDPADKNFGKPEKYRIAKVETGDFFEVHHSRLLVFNGLPAPTRIRRTYQGWGNSIFNVIYERLRGMGDGHAGAEGILMEFVIGIMKIKNLQSLIATPEGRATVLERLNLLDNSKHILNTLLLDEKEEFERISASGIGGMDDLLKRLEIALCAVSGIPFVKLFPEQVKGLGGTAEGNIRLYYDDISFDQEIVLENPLQKLIKYIMLSKNSEFKGTPPESWNIKFNKLWQPTEKEIAETKKINAETDQLYASIGLPAQIIILNRFGGESYSSETKLPEKFEKDLRTMVDKMDVEEEEDDEDDNDDNEGNPKDPNKEE